jgi:hypothetical protein
MDCYSGLMRKWLETFPFQLLILLIILLVAVLKLKYFTILFPVIFALAGVILFILLNRYHATDKPCVEKLQIQTDLPTETGFSYRFTVLSILFFIFYSTSLLSLLQGYYTKDIGYYISISACFGILIAETFLYRKQIEGWFVLLKTFLLTINVIFSNHLIYPHGISLPDYSLHYTYFVVPILKTGHISNLTLGFYNVFSFHHLFAAEGALLTGYDPLAIYLLLGSLIFVLGVLFVFLIGKRFVNFQFGLVAALLYSCFDYATMYGGHPEHQTYSFAMALICFTVVLYTYRYQKFAFYVLFVLSTIALVMTHYLTAVLLFVLLSSLLIIDIVHFLQKTDRTIPSKYMFVFFIVFLFFVLSIATKTQDYDILNYAAAMLKPYFESILSLFAHYLPASTPAASVPVTSVPVTSVPVTSVPVTSVPVTSVPVTSVPLASVPVTNVLAPVVTQTPVQIPPVETTSIYVPPTAYDKLPLLTLFENTLGSSLLVLASVLGFCSLIKKRTFLGDFTILNGILISFLLGLGILFSAVLFLPDRLYPFLQIFCLGFLGAFGILWLYNTVSVKHRTVIIIALCIFVAILSGFSLASIINGFETSPFVDGNIAYLKVYTTSQDVAFDEWRTTFTHVSRKDLLPLSFSKSGVQVLILRDWVDIEKVNGDPYLIFDRSLEKTGIVKSGNKFGQNSFIGIDSEYVQRMDTVTSYYDNGLINIMVKNQNPE